MARETSTTARSSETMSMTTSNGVTGSLVSPRQGFGEGAQHEQDHHHPVARPPAERSPITTLTVANPPQPPPRRVSLNRLGARAHHIPRPERAHAPPDHHATQP